MLVNSPIRPADCELAADRVEAVRLGDGAFGALICNGKTFAAEFINSRSEFGNEQSEYWSRIAVVERMSNDMCEEDRICSQEGLERRVQRILFPDNVESRYSRLSPHVYLLFVRQVKRAGVEQQGR